jgi:N6-L-threonylcarbamoyladenine synthase
MINTSDFDFSFSGLKTAVLREIKKLTAHNLQLTQDLRTIPGIERKKFRELTLAKRECVSPVTDFLAHEVQEAITDVLVEKTIRAATIYKVKTILLAGGVAANQRLREKMKLEIGPPAGGWKLEIKLFAPPKNLCTDNAAMIASAAFFNFRPLPWQKITSHPDLEV